MKLIFQDPAWEDYSYWQTVDKSILKKINALIKEIRSTPFEGLGKSEPLKYEFAGCWSRRINLEHRLIYRVEKDAIIILQCSYHYL